MCVCARVCLALSPLPAISESTSSVASVGEYLAGGKEFLLREILLRDKLLQLMLKELLEVDVCLRPLQPLLAVLRHEKKDRSV